MKFLTIRTILALLSFNVLFAAASAEPVRERSAIAAI